MAKIAGASEPALAVYKNVFITLRVYDNRYKYTFKIDGIGKPIQLVLGKVQPRILRIWLDVRYVKIPQLCSCILR